MYLYNIYGYEHSIILTHEMKYSQKDFEKICKEVPMIKAGSIKCYDDCSIIDHLADKYGFKKAKYTAGFCTNGTFHNG